MHAADLSNTLSSVSTLPTTASDSLQGEVGSLFERHLLAALGPSLIPQDIKDAVSLKDKPLFQNYKNWLAMARLIDSEVASLPGLAGEVTKAKLSTNEAAEVLRHFNWAPTSYYKKRRLFLWAHSAACMSWSGLTGSERLCLSINLPSYKRNVAGIHQTWKGIVYLWGRDGAFQRNSKPEKQSPNPDERHASKLTQDAIEKKKSDISRHVLEAWA